MARETLFSFYLSDRMKERDYDALTLSRELGYRTLVPVTGWCEGGSLPLPFELHRLATVLEVDPVALSVTWLAAQCYDLEEVLNNEVLIPRGAPLPRIV